MAAFEQERDQTLMELCEQLAARGIATSRSGLSRFFQRRGNHAQKKTGHAVEQDRPDVLSQRRAWFDAQPGPRPGAAGVRRR
jgi:transposase